MAIAIKDSAGNAPEFKQWESGRVLVITGLEDQPTLRFANLAVDHSLPVPATAGDNDDWIIPVPNYLLQFAGPLVISVMVGSDEVQEVAAVKYIVKPRMKPLDYTYEDNVGYINWKNKASLVDALIAEIQAKLASGDFDGPRGDPGFSPTVSVTSITGGHRVSITDEDETNTFDVMDGDKGDDGVSPTITSEAIAGGHRLTIVDAYGTTTVDVMDGEDGADVFWATKDTTTSAQIEAAYQAGKVCLCEYSSRVYRLNYRTSSTQHTFVMSRANTVYALECNNDAWSSTTYALAQSANIPSAASNAPADLGTAAKGSSSKYAREDHVHNKPTYTAADVGAIAAPVSANDDDVLTYDDGAWVAKPGGGGGGPSPYTSNPAALGTASPGSSSNYARGDHVHPKPSASDLGAVAADQGAGNAGKWLKVDTDGSVITADLPVYSGGVS